ncbi:MAG: FIG01964566: Predicted membrane protein, hemolysin III homolog, partial [uncultured Nocardioides sp.]
ERHPARPLRRALGARRRGHRRGQASPARLVAPRQRPRGPRCRDRAGRAVPRCHDPHRVRRVRRHRAGALHRVGDLPPRQLVTRRPGAAEALRPLQHLPADRRLLHPLRPAAARRPGAVADACHRLERRPRRGGHEGPLEWGTALAIGPHLHRARLGPGVLLRRLRQRRRGALRRQHRNHRHRARRGRRCVLHHRRRHLWHQAAQPVAAVVRLPRGLPHLHDPRLRQPLRRCLGGDLLPAL